MFSVIFPKLVHELFFILYIWIVLDLLVFPIGLLLREHVRKLVNMLHIDRTEIAMDGP